MDLDKMQAIMDKFEDSDIRELKIDENDFHLYLSKNRTNQAASPTTAKAASPTTAKNVAPKEAPTSEKAVEPKPEAKLSAVTAPLVGVVYLQAKPGQPAYVKPGDHIKKGDTVCIIEAMKMMTEVKSKISGTVVEVKVENEDLVEVGQPLVMVRED